MSETFEKFIKDLEINLKDLPKSEIKEAVNYYTEYVNDACESGRDINNVIEQLGSVKKIAETIKMEVSLNRVQNTPSIRNYGKVVKNILCAVTNSFSVFLLSLFVVISYSIVVMFFAASICFFIAGIAVLILFIFEISKIPGSFFMEIIGTVGISLVGISIMTLITIMFYQLAVLFVKISVFIISRIIKRPAKDRANLGNRQIMQKRFTIVSSIIFVIGLLLFSISGLPVRYFMIFNSMEPMDVQLETFDFRIDETEKIYIETAHSKVEIIEGTNDKIQFKYEKPDWLDCVVENSNGKLSFLEKSNGRLPLFELVSLHESLTEIKLILPKEYDPTQINIKSTGGHISINTIENINAQTMNGWIEVKLEKPLEPYNLETETKNGNIYSKNVPVGQKSEASFKYCANKNADKTMKLLSSNGSIHLD